MHIGLHVHGASYSNLTSQKFYKEKALRAYSVVKLANNPRELQVQLKVP